MAKGDGKRKSGPPPAAKDKLTALGIEAVCSKIIAGESMTSIATGAGVSIGTLIAWLDADPERSACAREARRQSARMWDERALEEIDAAKDPFNLAKAREKAQHLRWRASKIAPREYGEKLAIGGAEDLPPVRTEAIDLKGLSADELATMKQLLAKGKAALGEGQLG